MTASVRASKQEGTKRRSLLIAIVALVMAARGHRAEAAGACTGSEPRVVVDTATHQLTLCAQGHATAVFDVRLGRGGVGKKKEGDSKTPLGTYALGEPRPSTQFGFFIPIGYPTPEQRRHGYTGGDVGVHGPHRWVRWLGALVNTFDSSDGCVGLATDQEINTIASWVTKAHARSIEIH